MAFSKQTSAKLVKKVKTAFEELKSEGFLETVEEMYRLEEQRRSTVSIKP